MDTKKCPKCGDLKPVSEFYIDRAKRDGHKWECKQCTHEHNISWNAEHQYEKRAYMATYRSAHQDEIRAYDNAHRVEKRENNAKWHAAHPEKIRAYALKRYYGLSDIDYNAMISAQQGKCAICGCDNNGKRLYVDHNHETGKLRGLLCNNCNLVLGNCKDDPEILRKAAIYLEKRY